MVFFGSGAYSALDNMKVSVAAAATEPDPLKGKDLRVDGDGGLWGGGFKLVIGSRWHGGLGMNIFGASGYQLRYAPLVDGMKVATSSVWGETFDLFFGREWPLWGMRPYIDLRAALTVFQANVKLESDKYGVLGSTPYDGLSFGLGPRAGVTIPLGTYFFIDLSAYGSPIGVEKFASTLGIGISTAADPEPRKTRRRRRPPPPTW